MKTKIIPKVPAVLLMFGAFLLPSCETVPVSFSYTGMAAGHEITAGYGRSTGVIVAMRQK